MNRIRVANLHENHDSPTDDIRLVVGGTITDGTSNTILFGEAETSVVQSKREAVLRLLTARRRHG